MTSFIAAAAVDQALTDHPYKPGVITPSQRDNLSTVGQFCPSWFTWVAGSKAPTNPRTGAPGKVDDPSTAGSFEIALGNIPTGGGLGVLMTDAKPEIVALDFDHVIEGGVFTPLGTQVVEQFKNAYVEVSPSGTGLRVFALGSVNTPRQRGGGVELYPAGSKRWLRMTGAVITSTLGAVGPCQAGIDWAVGLLLKAPDKVGSAVPGRASSDALTVDQVLDRLAAYRGNDGKAAAEVQDALMLSASRKPSGELAVALALMVSGAEKSEHDYLVMCDAFRRGIATIEDAGELLAMLATRDKVKRKDYQKSTAENAARAVLKEIETPGFNRNGFRAQVWGNLPDKEGDKAPPVPDGVAEALADLGEVIVRTTSGKVIPTPGNVKAILMADPRTRGLLAFNESTQEVERAGSWRVFDQHAADKPGNLQDIDISFTAAWLLTAWRVNMNKGDVCEGIEMAARAKACDSLRDSLMALVWDGKPRAHSWLKDYAMVDDTGCSEYVSQAGACFLVGAVARALDPGCELHTALTLEGSGGGGKSNMFKILAGALGPDLFTDSIHDVTNAVHVVESTEGKFIVEIAELSTFRRAADQDALKKALSARRDKVRKPYMRKPVEIPRRFVFVATTNQDQYIADPTGAASRRFMPVRTKATEANPIDRAALAGVAPQLWAEAVHLYLDKLQGTYIDPNSVAGKQWAIERGERQEDLPFDEAVDLLMMAIERGAVPAYRIGPNGSGGITANDAAKAMGLDTEKVIDGKYTDRVAKTLRAKGFIRLPKSNNFRRWLMPPALFLRASRMRAEMGKKSCLLLGGSPPVPPCAYKEIKS